MNNKANPNSTHAAVPIPAQQPVSRRLIAALLLIGLAIGGLALKERWHQRPTIAPPPHEPSQALIELPSAEPPTESVQADHPAESPRPPYVENTEKLAVPAKPSAALATTGAKIAGNRSPATGKAYVVQVGVFMTPANAQALQQQLAKSGIPAHTETRVQLGPFQDRREAETALAKVKKLGVNAVLIAPR